jgi:GNAT superfamily N-acetyltransferase
VNAGPTEIRRLEEISGRAWPPRLRTAGPGWEARFADGMHRRVNSATVWPEAAGDLVTLLAQIEDWYRGQGRPAVFKLTEASAPGFDDLLAARGYEVEAPTQVWSRVLPLDAGRQTAITAVPTDEWTSTFAAALGYDDERRRLLRAQLARITLPTGYGILRSEGHPATVGLAVADGSHVGIFEVVTCHPFRGRGLAAVATRDLLGWGAERGAETGYLQVMEDNPAAMRVYRRLGFAARYRYWYRLPGDHRD